MTCLYCGVWHDLRNTPKTGDIIVCHGCARVLFVNENCQLRPLTRGEIEDFSARVKELMGKADVAAE